jgi:hypothetical protein
MTLCTDLDKKSLQPFCDQIWRHKKSTHNRLMAFYDHLQRQPTLAKGESAIVRLVNGKSTEGLLCFMKYFYKGLSVYQGLNLYTLSSPEKRAMSGATLLNYWARHCDAMFSAGPRGDTLDMYERSGWTRVNTTSLIFFPSVSSALHAWRLNPTLSSLRKTISELKHSRIAHHVAANALNEPITSFGRETDDFLESLNHHYQFLERDSDLMNWRYFTFIPPDSRYEAFHVRHATTNSVIGYYILSLGKSVIKVCEVMALPDHWEDVVTCIRARLLRPRIKQRVTLQSNYPALIDICRNQGFNTQKVTPNYFKTRSRNTELMRAVQSDTFLISPSDSDEYL